MQGVWMRALIVALLLGFTGCTTGAGARPTAQPQAPAGDLTLGPGDAFEVHVYDEEDLSGKYRVGDDGNINFPLVGGIPVAGKTTAEIAKTIQSALEDGKILRRPHVSVYLVEQTSRQVSIMGAVKQPGNVPLTRGMTVVQALSLAGGLTPIANGDGTIVTRRVNGELTRHTVAVEKITEGRAEDFALQPGDIVFVPERLF
jgi:polysaccharide export outer membrane protein